MPTHRDLPPSVEGTCYQVAVDGVVLAIRHERRDNKCVRCGKVLR